MAVKIFNLDLSTANHFPATSDSGVSHPTAAGHLFQKLARPWTHELSLIRLQASIPFLLFFSQAAPSLATRSL